MKNIDLYYMHQALILAGRGRLTVSPNPMVGCIIVKNGQIVGEGWHQKAGQPHAEIYAIKMAGEKAHGATVYVTLEPCCHTGRTGPCTDALIAAKVKRIVIATLDPNPKVAGKGVFKLTDAGIVVEVGVLAEQAKHLNKIFFHYQQTRKPYVFAKWAMSLDGKISVKFNDCKQISSEKSREYTHQTRNICDAIVIGKNTLLRDNPKLDVRVGVLDILNPIRFIVFSKLNEIDSNWHVLDQKVAKTIFVCTDISSEAEEKLSSLNIDFWLLPAAEDSRKVYLEKFLEKAGLVGISSILVEGGKGLLNDFINQKLVDEFMVYISPVLIADFENKQKLSFDSVSRLDKDILVNAKVKGDN
ncbi:bifunctional diaminohydroxyphosphoribosylaminopyrimidine deaminase/5-amino-6-(5-phosphoribosylamino)uracil reductase RibD [Pseudofrancisella aestuarii]|uniref:Riboflavin biosynthesis protein RibD n=1 Tax=Pseudofrancisella aestuarii TaxID=2670347 RepID=A0ABV9TCR3_9GAMM|nr:bifunctional diaminohydroxyphosphoribosylaminopyrimidine deaminase/5-amino-6-(5-phosphoribosylamino)uracil reductase RibD [Pseudofrancisella aestuarii]